MSNILGVDIGIDTIKVVSVSKSGEEFILDVIGETKTPNNEWQKSNGKGKSFEDMVTALKGLLADLKIRPDQAVACLPEDEIVSRVVQLPPLKESEIRDVLRYEAETFVPYPLDQVSIDYEVIEKDDAERLTVFVIAARNELIKNYISLFKASGLELIALESPAVAMRRMIKIAVSPVEGIVIVDMGEKYSDIVSFIKGKIYFARSMSVGGESFTRAISINLGLDMASAEEYKKAYGMKETELEGKIRNAIIPVFNNVAEEIRKTMALFVEDHGKSIDLLVLSGGGANLPGLAEELAKILGVEVQIMQPFLKIKSTNVNLPINLSTEGSRFGLATGLALRSLA